MKRLILIAAVLLALGGCTLFESMEDLRKDEVDSFVNSLQNKTYETKTNKEKLSFVEYYGKIVKPALKKANTNSIDCRAYGVTRNVDYSNYPEVTLLLDVVGQNGVRYGNNSFAVTIKNSKYKFVDNTYEDQEIFGCIYEDTPIQYSNNFGTITVSGYKQLTALGISKEWEEDYIRLDKNMEYLSANPLYYLNQIYESQKTH